jgi:hypothetical protein
MMSDAALPIAPAGVWVQILVGEEKQGESFEIEQTPRNVNALKMAVFPELTPREVAKCLVFAPGADPKTEIALKANALVPGDATYENPLIVVAPKQHQQPPQQDGELQCCSRILVYSMYIVRILYGNASFSLFKNMSVSFSNHARKNLFCVYRYANSLSTRS